MQLPEDLFEPVAERLRLLADSTRLRILTLLRDGELSVIEVVAATGASQPNVSRHRPSGRRVCYRVVDPFIDRICEAICGSLRSHVDRQALRLRVATPRPPSSRPTATTSPTGTAAASPRAPTRRRRM